MKKVFRENQLQEYVSFDKKHHDHTGYIMIEKIKDKTTIDAIIHEWYDITSKDMVTDIPVAEVSDDRDDAMVKDEEQQGDVDGQ